MDKDRTKDEVQKDIYMDGEIKSYGERKKCFIKQINHTETIYELNEGDHIHTFYELNEGDHVHGAYRLKEIKHAHAFHVIKEVKHTRSLYELKPGDDIEIKDCSNGEEKWIPGKVRTEEAFAEGFMVDENGLGKETYIIKIWLFDGAEKTAKLEEGTPARIRIQLE